MTDTQIGIIGLGKMGAALAQQTAEFTDPAVPDGFLHTGPAGSGHYVKLVHNGIKFGMLQAIGEGVNLLTNYRAPLPISEVRGLWNRSSVIRSWHIELMKTQFDERPSFDVPSCVEDTGEVNRLVADALRMEVPIPVIAQAVIALFGSRDADKTSARAVAMMRHGLGGHPFGADAGIQHERRFGQVEGFPRLPATK